MYRWLVPLGLLVLIGCAARSLFGAAFWYSDDGLLHVLRAFAFDQTIQQGVVYPRWVDDLAFGLGYPIFNFYPPLAAYGIETGHLLGLDFVGAFKFAAALSVALAAVGAYTLGAELFPDAKRAAGMLTAIAFVGFPYFLIDLYTRGAIAELLAMALLPWTVWAVRRTLTAPTISATILTALLLALMLLAHSLTLVVAAPILAVFGGIAIPRAPDRRRAAIHLAGAIILGAGLSAFYWLPFAAELALVRMGRNGVPLGAVFPDHFLQPSALIQTSPLYQFGNPPFPLGLAPVLLGACGWLGAFIAGKRMSSRAFVIACGGIAVLGSLALIEPARDVWLALPGALMLQYPWRIQVILGLAFAILIGSLANWFALWRRLGILAWALCAGGLGGAVFATLTPLEIFLPSAAPTLGQLARFEARTKFIGTTTWGEYLPASFRVTNLATWRAPRASVARATMTLTRYEATRREMTITTTEPISISLRAFYFPDWRATIDGQPARAYANTALGLLATEVPAGTHRVAFELGDTAPRQIGIGVTVLAAILGGGLLAFAFRRREADARAPAFAALLAFAVFAIPAGVALAAPPRDLQTLRVGVSPALELIGVRVDGAPLRDDAWRVSDLRGELDVRLYWHVRDATQDQPLTWRLVDARGAIAATRAQLSRYGTGFAASWFANELVEDRITLALAGLRPGRYQLQVAWGDAREFLPLTQIELARGGTATAAQPAFTPIHARIGEKIRLAGFVAPDALTAGAPFSLTLFWQADENVYDDFTAFVQVLDADGNAVAKHDSVPGGGLASPFLWSPGEWIADRIVLRVPRDLKPGLYRVIVGMYHYPELDRLPVTNVAGERVEDDVIELGVFPLRGGDGSQP